MSDTLAAQKGHKLLGIFRGFVTAGVEPDEMGVGPVERKGFRLIAATHIAHQPEKGTAVDGRAAGSRRICPSRLLDRYPFTFCRGRTYEAECLYFVCRLT